MTGKRSVREALEADDGGQEAAQVPSMHAGTSKGRVRLAASIHWQADSAMDVQNQAIHDFLFAIRFMTAAPGIPPECT